MRERGRTVESVLTQYKESVSPMHDAFIAKGRKWADYHLETHEGNMGISSILECFSGIMDI